MIHSLKRCEICEQQDWQELGTKSYSKASTQNLSEYEQKRFRVLFEKWFPGVEEVTLKQKVCRRCGFLLFEPRPETADIDAKYRFLESLGQDYGHLPYDSPIEKLRSAIIYHYIKKKIDLNRVKSVLDYGGGDGRLMQAFIHSDKKCFNLDYNQSTIPAVQKLGDTIEALNPNQRFDLIICSHVLEHVADPKDIVRKLSQYLSPKGYLYIEVPAEVWKKPPPKKEPVTHINFFTPSSVQNMITHSGLKHNSIELTAYLHSSEKWLHCVRGIGQQKDPSDKTSPPMKPADYRWFLRPNLLGHIQRYWVKKKAMTGQSKIKPWF